MTARMATRKRKTRETDIAVSLNLDGTGVSQTDTGIGFLNHMLELLSRHALVDLEVTAVGDIDVDYHHTVEDVGLVLGACIDEALGDRRGICRYGFASLPMDDSLSEVSIDLGGRPYLIFNSDIKRQQVRDFDVKLLEEFFRAVSVQARMNLHINHRYGDDAHHVCESIFKGFARALRQAVTADPRESGVPSSKGTL